MKIPFISTPIMQACTRHNLYDYMTSTHLMQPTAKIFLRYNPLDIFSVMFVFEETSPMFYTDF